MLVHRLDRGEILFDNRVKTSASLVHVAQDTSYDSHVRVRVNVYLDVKHLDDFRVLKCHDTFDDDHFRAFCFYPLVAARVCGKIVGGMIYRFAAFELLNMLHKQIHIERIGVIVVDLATLFIRHIAVVLVIAVHAEHDAVFAKRFVNPFCESGFAAARAACYAYDDTAHFRSLQIQALGFLLGFFLEPALSAHNCSWSLPPRHTCSPLKTMLP